MNRIFILATNYFLILISPLWVPPVFSYAFFFSEEYKGARRGEGYLLK